MNSNEIRDYLERAPKRFGFNGYCMVNHTYARYNWLASIARGTLDDKINRRAGIVETLSFWKTPCHSSYKRKLRRVKKFNGSIK